MTATENYWPIIQASIQQWLARRGHLTSAPSLAIEPIVCSICRESELTIAEFKHDGKEDGIILGCGHFVGKDCMAAWHATRRQGSQTLTCPFCRCCLNPSRCPHHRVQNINVAVDEPFEVVVEKIWNMTADNASNSRIAKDCPDCILSSGGRARHGGGPKRLLTQQELRNAMDAAVQPQP